MPVHVSSTMCSSSGVQNCCWERTASPLPTCAPDGHLQSVMIPDAV